MKEQVAIEARQQVLTRLVPFTALTVTATTQGGADVFETGSTGQGAMLVERLAVVNTTASPVTLSIMAGGAFQLSEYEIAANDAVDLTEIIGGYYPNGQSITAWAGTASALVLSGYWREVF